MKFSDVTVLFVPGLRDHVADHWQTILAAEIPGSVTVEPLTENRLCRKARVAALDAALARIDGDVVIAAHSAGALMTVHWAQAPTRKIRGALLATPADLENPLPPAYPSMADLTEGGWLPIPRKLLPFPAIVAASRNDPLAQFEKLAGLAKMWGAELHDAGEVGHLNSVTGFGRWDEAVPLLERLAAR